LLAPEEIMLQFAQGKMLVLPQGSRPVVTDRVAYFNDPGLAGLWDDPRTPQRPPVEASFSLPLGVKRVGRKDKPRK
jgi:hypothetical protein